MHKEKRTYLYICVLTGCLLALISGLPLSWTSPVIPILEGSTSANPLPNPIDATESSWIISLLCLGAVVGPFLTMFTTKLTGLKYTLIGIGIAYVISFLILAFINDITAYLIARILAGLAMGSVYSVLPPYIADVSPDDVRGTMGSLFNIFIVIGIMIPYCVGPYVSIFVLNMVCAGLSIIFVIAFIFMPESPVYLITKQRKSEAKQVLQKLRGNVLVDIEFELMIETENKNTDGGIGDIFKISSNFKALIISLSLVAFQQLSGVRIVTVNTQTIFEESGSSIPSDISSIIIGAVQIGASCIVPFFVDSLGRRILLILSTIIMLISEVPLGVYFYLKDDNFDVSNLYWLPITCLVFYVMAFNIGSGPIVWTITAEVFPPNMMSYGSAIAASVCWIISFFLTYFYADIINLIGIGGSFWLFSVCNVFAIIFILLFVPETKGKTTIEIQEMLK